MHYSLRSTQDKIGWCQVMRTGCRYEDGGRVRPVLHRASLVEMCVVSPAVDPSGTSNSKCFARTLDRILDRRVYAVTFKTKTAMHLWWTPVDNALLLCSRTATLTRPSSARCVFPPSRTSLLDCCPLRLVAAQLLHACMPCCSACAHKPAVPSPTCCVSWLRHCLCVRAVCL